MSFSRLLAALAVSASPPAVVQAQSMPGMGHMSMPMPTKPASAKAKPKPTAKPAAKSPSTHPQVMPAHHHGTPPTAAQTFPASTASSASPSSNSTTTDDRAATGDAGMTDMAMDHGTMDHGTMDHGAMDHGAMDRPTPSQPQNDAAASVPTTGDHMGMMHEMPAEPAAMDHGAMDHQAMAMPGYAIGSGTSRVPANDGAMHGIHFNAGNWALMAHGFVTGAYTNQGGPRGDDKAFSASMLMLTGTRDLSDTVHLRLQSMLSLDAAMGASGYPNLFATGETADGINPLIDRQHPHDLFMELSARLDVDLGSGSAFVYAAPVGEPALGPSVFMMRSSGKYLPVSPITHHWFDSTHISYGVVTAGYAARAFQIEASAFRGREPDQHRWDFEAPALDSWSVRASWLPAPAWAVQVSHGFLKSPEQLEPDTNERRTTASVQYARHGVSALVGFSAKDKGPGRTLTAWIAEASWSIGRHHALFGRLENVANDELFPDAASPLHDQRFRVTKLEGGYAYRVPLGRIAELALGGSVAGYAYPAALDAAYGRSPVSFTLFGKLSLGQ